MADFNVLRRYIHNDVQGAMRLVGEEIAHEMKNRLASGDHIDTGALRDSIRQETKIEGDSINTYVYADAKSPEGTMYAEFIEYGTGKYRPGGRKDGWYYVYHGNKMTPAEIEWLDTGNNRSKYNGGVLRYTEGMKSDPFIEPAVAEGIKHFEFAIKDILNNIVRYGRG